MSSDSDCMFHCTFPGCNYETNRSAHLKRHERIHTKERPYKCPFCNYCASRSDHLRRHYKIHGKLLTSINRARKMHSVQMLQQGPRSGSQSVTIPVYTPISKPIDQGSKPCSQFLTLSCNLFTVHS